MGVEVTVDLDTLQQQIMTALKPHIDRALAVVEEVPQLLKLMVMDDEKDVDGGTFNKKKPRPKKSPRNFPNIPCLDTGNMFDNERWVNVKTSDTEAAVTYSPPDYFEHLIEKDPEHG